nr:hypothetical protein [Brucella anthropi]
MMSRRVCSTSSLPLLIWNELAEIGRLQAQRQCLETRIAVLRPHSHRRVELEAKLRDVTAAQLKIEATIRGKS